MAIGMKWNRPIPRTVVNEIVGRTQGKRSTFIMKGNKTYEAFDDGMAFGNERHYMVTVRDLLKGNETAFSLTMQGYDVVFCYRSE